MMTGPFRLYPEEQHFLSFLDYGAILSTVERLRPATVLEFGPGWSSLALVEGGATRIDACEDADSWRKLWHDRLRKYPQVTVQWYEWADPLTVPQFDGERYDMGLIDGPYDVAKRPAVIDYCLQRCAAVLVPLELGDAFDLRPVVWALAEKHGCLLETRETGMLAGAFALMTRVP